MRRWVWGLMVPGAAVAAPFELAWQGRLLDGNGHPLEAPTSLTIDVFATSTSTPALWSDSFSVDPDDGFVSVMLGSGVALDLSDFSSGEVWAQPRLGATTLGPRSRIANVPFSLVSAGVRSGALPSGACGPAGQLWWDTSAGALFACDGAAWVATGGGSSAATVVSFGGAPRQWSNGGYAASCDDYIRPDSGYSYTGATGDGLYWIDPDGSGSNAPFSVWCDMTVDDGGWTLVAWANTTSETWSGTPLFATYSGSSSATPSSADFSNWSGTIASSMASQPQNVRMTYLSGTAQSTLNVTTNTLRMYTNTSTFTGVLNVGPTPIANRTNETANHNCTGYTHIAANGTQSTVNKGCWIEYTNGDIGNWAGCGTANNTATGGVGFGLCFDNGDATANRGNSALHIWHQGLPTYHEIYPTSYYVTTPPNVSWGSFGGHWTWSAWIRRAN